MGTEITKRCIIISGALNPDVAYIQAALDNGCFLIAADSGHQLLAKLGVQPDIIIADFDSSVQPSSDCAVINFPVEKDATDTFNSVKYAIANGYNDITILNALGGRIDHTYSNILCLDYCRKNNAVCKIADRNNRLSLITETTVIKKEYQWFSLFAFLEDCKGVKLSGAHYTAGFFGLPSLDLKQGDQFAQSNYIENGECEISLASGTLLLIEANDL